jgi:hypothetical protein
LQWKVYGQGNGQVYEQGNVQVYEQGNVQVYEHNNDEIGEMGNVSSMFHILVDVFDVLIIDIDGF